MCVFKKRKLFCYQKRLNISSWTLPHCRGWVKLNSHINEEHSDQTYLQEQSSSNIKKDSTSTSPVLCTFERKRLTFSSKLNSLSDATGDVGLCFMKSLKLLDLCRVICGSNKTMKELNEKNRIRCRSGRCLVAYGAGLITLISAHTHTHYVLIFKTVCVNTINVQKKTSQNKKRSFFFSQPEIWMLTFFLNPVNQRVFVVE